MTLQYLTIVGANHSRLLRCRISGLFLCLYRKNLCGYDAEVAEITDASLFVDLDHSFRD